MRWRRCSLRVKEMITQAKCTLPNTLCLSVAHRCLDTLLPPTLDAGLGFAAVVHLDIDLGILLTLVSEALKVATVAQ